MVFTDASTTGWGATFNGLAVSGVWTGPPTALAHKLTRVAGSTPGPEPSQEALTGQALTGPYGHTVTVAYINQQGGLRFRRMLQLTRHLLLWSQKHLRSLRAIHIPGLLNRAADELSRAALPGEWRLHPQTAQLIERLLIASCLLPDRGNTRHGMHWPRGPRKYAFPPSEPSRTDTVQDQGGRGAGLARGVVLAHSDLIPRTDAPRDSPSLADSSEAGSTDSETGHLMAPASRPLET